MGRQAAPNVAVVEQSQRSFERLALYTNPSLTLAGDDDAELVRAEVVSPSYLPLLRVSAERGRVFLDAEDDVANPTPVVLISHSLWTRRWGADPAILGSDIRVNGVPLTIVGVLPDGFHGLSGRADIWVPTAMASCLPAGSNAILQKPIGYTGSGSSCMT